MSKIPEIHPYDKQTYLNREQIAEYFVALVKAQNTAKTRIGHNTHGAENVRFQIAVAFCATCAHCELNLIDNTVALGCVEGETPLNKVQDGTISKQDVSCNKRSQVE